MWSFDLQRPNLVGRLLHLILLIVFALSISGCAFVQRAQQSADAARTSSSLIN
jgi:hypothetical protein